VIDSSFFVDRRDSALHEAGEFLIPKAEGLIGDDHILGEIGEVLSGMAPGRSSPDEITVFKSLGIAVEDLAAAYHVLNKARQANMGTWLEMGGLHFGSA
jgi:ornithine cyclodeaminase